MFTDYKFSAEDEKYYLFLPLVTFKERYVERAKLKFKKYFLNRQIRCGVNLKMRTYKGLKIMIKR